MKQLLDFLFHRTTLICAGIGEIGLAPIAPSKERIAPAAVAAERRFHRYGREFRQLLTVFVNN